MRKQLLKQWLRLGKSKGRRILQLAMKIHVSRMLDIEAIFHKKVFWGTIPEGHEWMTIHQIPVEKQPYGRPTTTGPPPQLLLMSFVIYQTFFNAFLSFQVGVPPARHVLAHACLLMLFFERKYQALLFPDTIIPSFTFTHDSQSLKLI